MKETEGKEAFHARQILKKLTSRPHLPLIGGIYNKEDDEKQMLIIIEKYLRDENLIR